mgnify:CR=1 FL=1
MLLRREILLVLVSMLQLTAAVATPAPQILTSKSALMQITSRSPTSFNLLEYSPTPCPSPTPLLPSLSSQLPWPAGPSKMLTILSPRASAWTSPMLM